MATIGSLFSGIGGLELGLEEAIPGARVIWQAEIDPAARAVLAQHWPDVRRYNDVREIDGEAERPDIICGGFPCTDISVAGAGAGIAGEQSGLWREFARIIRALQPGVVFIENVAALASRGLDEVLRDLAKIGFDAEWECFRAADAGAPHRRDRLFLLAYANGRGREGERLSQLEGLGGARGGFTDGCRAERYVHCFPPGPARIGDWLGPQPAIRRSADGRAVGLDRRWSPVNGRADRLRLLGNAVVPQCAALAWRTLAARVSDKDVDIIADVD